MGTEIRTTGERPLRVVAALALSPAARDLLAEQVNAEVVGAHGYYVGESVAALGAFIRAEAEVRASAGTPVPALDPGEDELDAVIEEIIRRRPATARRRERD